jgi:hypothetical protein
MPLFHDVLERHFCAGSRLAEQVSPGRFGARKTTRGHQMILLAE